MAIENPYRSLESLEKRTQGKSKALGGLFAYSRLLLVSMLLICAVVIFLVHGLGYDGYGDVKVEYKEALKRLRGPAGGTLEARAADPSPLQAGGSTASKSENQLATDPSPPTADGRSKHSPKPSGEEDGSENSEAHAKKSATPRPIPVIEKASDGIKANKLDIAPATAKGDEQVHRHNTIHKVEPKPLASQERTVGGSQEQKAADKAADVQPVPVRPHSLVQPTPHQDEKEKLGSIHVPPLEEAPNAKRVTKVQADMEKKKEEARALARQMAEKEKAKAALTEKPHNIAPARRPKNPYDLKPGAKKAREAKAAKSRDKHEDLIKTHGCDGSVDPFEGQPVESFEPPEGASVKDKMEWKNKVREMMKNIKAQKSGGKALRKFMDDEVDRLTLTRMSLFCEAYVKEHDRKGADGGGAGTHTHKTPPPPPRR